MNECWCALAVAVLSQNYSTPEMAFECLVNGRKLKKNIMLTDADFEDMLKMKDYLTYKEIGDIYGLEESSAFRRMKKYKAV